MNTPQPKPSASARVRAKRDEIASRQRETDRARNVARIDQLIADGLLTVAELCDWWTEAAVRDARKVA